MTAGGLRTIAGTDGKQSLEAGGSCCIEFRGYIRYENHLRRLRLKCGCNFLVTFYIGLAARGGIEVAGDVSTQIARDCVGEEQLLRQHAPTRKDGDFLSLFLPAHKHARNVVKEFSPQRAATVAFFPDYSLNELKRRRLAILRCQPFHIGNHGLNFYFRSVSWKGGGSRPWRTSSRFCLRSPSTSERTCALEIWRFRNCSACASAK